MNIVYYTSGISGSGRIVTGIAIYNALRRKHIDCTYTMITHSPAGYLAELQGINHIYLPLEDEYQLSQKHFHSSVLYHTLSLCKPDIVLVYLQWFTVINFLNEFQCVKIFLVHQVDKKFFTIDTPLRLYEFNAQQYSAVVSIEPFDYPFTVLPVNPVVLRNHNEILTRDEAQKKLHMPSHAKGCLISISGYESEAASYNKYYDSSSIKQYHCVIANNYGSEVLFPVIDYFNAFDLVICGAGYNSFWETRFFHKKAIIIPFKRHFEDQILRVKKFYDYSFTVNGADQLVDMLMMM